MRMISTALLSGFALATLLAPAAAQDAARDAAIARCVKIAQAAHPGDSTTVQSDRTAAYKACMTKAGFAP